VSPYKWVSEGLAIKKGKNRGGPHLKGKGLADINKKLRDFFCIGRRRLKRSLMTGK